MTRLEPTDGSQDERPSWLVEGCPAWCARDHAERDHVEDRYHQSAPSIVPVIAGAGGSIPVTAMLGAVDLVIRRGQHVGDRRAWVAIEAAEGTEPRFVVTAESARSIVKHLEDQLGRIPPADA